MFKRRTHKTRPDIYVTKNQEVQGPYTASEIRRRISSSEYSDSDMSWQEGDERWLQLSELLASLPAKPVNAQAKSRKFSGLARSSYYIGLFGFMVWLLLGLPIAASLGSDAHEASTLKATIGVVIYGYMGADFLGIIFSVLALVNRGSSLSMALYGLFFNALLLLLFGLIMS